MTGICVRCGLAYTTITSTSEQTECPACGNRIGSDNERGIDVSEERDDDGLLSNWALAQDALQDAGCDCGQDEPGMCLMCRCRAALDEERNRVLALEAVIGAVDVVLVARGAHHASRAKALENLLHEYDLRAAGHGEAFGMVLDRMVEAEKALARLGGPDPDRGLWRELLRISGAQDGTPKATIVAVIRAERMADSEEGDR